MISTSENEIEESQIREVAAHLEYLIRRRDNGIEDLGDALAALADAYNHDDEDFLEGDDGWVVTNQPA